MRILRRLIFTLLFVSLGCLFIGRPPTIAASYQPAEKTYRATNFDQQIQLQADGSMRVYEQITFHFNGGPFNQMYRYLPQDKTDGVTIERASMDDPLADGIEDYVGVNAPVHNQVTVNWALEDVSNSTHTFYLAYLVKGIVQQRTQDDWVPWNGLLAQHDYAIDSATIAISYPLQSQLRTQNLIGGQMPTTTVQPGLLMFSAKNLRPDESIETDLSFSPGSLIQQAPRWQQQQQLAAQIVWPCLLASILLLILVPILFAKLSRKCQYHLPKEINQPQSITVPPDDLPPALVGILVADRTPKIYWNQFLATLYDLINRQIITFQASAKHSSITPQQLTRSWLELKERPENLLPYEQACIEILFQKSSPGEVQVSTTAALKGKYDLHVQKFSKSMRQAIQQNDWFDPRRQAIRKFFIVAYNLFSVLYAFGFSFNANLDLKGFTTYNAVYFLDSAFLVLAFVAKYHQYRCIPIKNEWLERAWRWRHFKLYMRNVCGNSMLFKQDITQAERYIPYAASMGLLGEWLYHFYGSTQQILPSWFIAPTELTNRQRIFQDAIAHQVL